MRFNTAIRLFTDQSYLTITQCTEILKRSQNVIATHPLERLGAFGALDVESATETGPEPAHGDDRPGV